MNKLFIILLLVSSILHAQDNMQTLRPSKQRTTLQNRKKRLSQQWGFRKPIFQQRTNLTYQQPAALVETNQDIPQLPDEQEITLEQPVSTTSNLSSLKAIAKAIKSLNLKIQLYCQPVTPPNGVAIWTVANPAYKDSTGTQPLAGGQSKNCTVYLVQE